MKKLDCDISGKIALIDDLPSPSPVIERLLSLMPGDGEGSPEELDEVISIDPAISAQVLRVANSAYFGFSGRISTISKAILLLGPKEVWTIAVGIAFHQQFSGLFTSKYFDLDAFWHHSFLTGVVEDFLAREIGDDELLLEEAMTMGILHDIGKLVLASYFVEEFERLHEYQKENMVSMLEAENALGLLHTDLGKMLCKYWKLPKSIEQAISEHHCFELSTTDAPSKNGLLTGLSNLIANELKKGGKLDIESPQFCQALEAHDWLRPLVDKVNRKTEMILNNAQEIFGLIKGD